MASSPLPTKMLLTVVLVLFSATQLLTAILGAAAQNTNVTCIPSYVTLVDKVLVWLCHICKESAQKEWVPTSYQE